MSEDMILVHRAATIEEADIVAAWLESRGIAAFVKDRNAIGAFGGGFFGFPSGVGVCVFGTEAADQAKQLLADHFNEQQDN